MARSLDASNDCLFDFLCDFLLSIFFLLICTRPGLLEYFWWVGRWQVSIITLSSRGHQNNYPPIPGNTDSDLSYFLLYFSSICRLRNLDCKGFYNSSYSIFQQLFVFYFDVLSVSVCHQVRFIRKYLCLTKNWYTTLAQLINTNMPNCDDICDPKITFKLTVQEFPTGVSVSLWISSYYIVVHPLS